MSLGSVLYTRVKLAGVRFNGNNMNVRVAYQLVNSEGRVVLDKPDFITINETREYHPRYFFLKINTYVTLPSQGPKGSYTQRFVVNDLKREHIDCPGDCDRGSIRKQSSRYVLCIWTEMDNLDVA